MTEVEPRFKESKPWICRKEDPECSRSVPCRSCLGRRNRVSGKRKQREARKALGIQPDYHGHAANEESWRHELRWECKSGKQVESLAARFLAAERQSDANKSTGDPRPFAFVAMPNGWGAEGVVAVRLSVWRTLWPMK